MDQILTTVSILIIIAGVLAWVEYTFRALDKKEEEQE